MITDTCARPGDHELVDLGLVVLFAVSEVLDDKLVVTEPGHGPTALTDHRCQMSFPKTSYPLRSVEFSSDLRDSLGHEIGVVEVFQVFDLELTLDQFDRGQDEGCADTTKCTTDQFFTHFEFVTQGFSLGELDEVLC